MNDKVKIVIADDHPIVRQGLRQLIEADRNLTVIGEASEGETALQLIETHQPDVAVLDIDMPRIGGFDVVRELERKKIRVKIIFLTMHTEEEIFQTAMDLGVGGYVLKDSAPNDIVAGIKSIAAGKPFISPAMSAAASQSPPPRPKIRKRKARTRFAHADRTPYPETDRR